MKLWFQSTVPNKEQSPTPKQDARRSRAWRLAQSLRDEQAHPWQAQEQVWAQDFVCQKIDAIAYRQGIYALTDWQNIQDCTDFAGLGKAEREYRADIIATMEIVIAQSERG